MKMGAAPRKQKWEGNGFAFEKRHQRTWRKDAGRIIHVHIILQEMPFGHSFRNHWECEDKAHTYRHLSGPLCHPSEKSHMFPLASHGDLGKQNPWKNNSCQTSLTPGIPAFKFPF